MKNILFVILVLGLVACTARPTIDTSPGAKFSYDGLAPVTNSRFEEAWADPDVDLREYKKVIAAAAEFEFRTHLKSRTSSAGRGRGAIEFRMSDEAKQKLIDEVTAAFANELQSVKGWEFVEEPGEETLILVGRFLDIVSHVPRSAGGTGEVMISSVGEVTLVIEAKDSLSGETLFRAVQRSTIKDRAGSIYVSPNNVASWSQVRLWAAKWATALREGLESINE
ncbi:MAG: hypothetical protein DRR15_02035 [Gammaproteobacteria bacterium]|nr:MAG: hypothetical protein DRR15_02035 [Gammaproteobacteria bacterium]